MSSVNKTIIVGHLGQDPEAMGESGCRFSVATTERWKSKDGQDKEHTEWHNVKAFGKQAQACLQHLAKGQLVYVEGSLRTTEWEEKRYLNLLAKQVVFLEGKGGDPQWSGGDPHKAPF